jgi:hypothetical protein
MGNRLKRRLSVMPLLLIVAILLATMIPQPGLAQDTGVAGNGFTFVVTSDMLEPAAHLWNGKDGAPIAKFGGLVRWSAPPSCWRCSSRWP